MARRTGTATLPLHTGRAPRWLFQRMTALARSLTEAIVIEHGPSAFLKRLSDPYWFQAFGCVLGFDWHSSGVTTTVCGALKQGLAGTEADTSILVAGGKGRTSRKTPDELRKHASRLGLDGESLVYASRMAAKVDSAGLQDGYQIYHHSFFFTGAGEWAVVQQGMHESAGSASSTPISSVRTSATSAWVRSGRCGTRSPNHPHQSRRACTWERNTSTEPPPVWGSY